MIVLKPQEDLLVELNPKFQRELFNQLLNKYSRNYLIKKLNKSSPTLYSYKNNKVKAIPKIIIIRAIKISDFSREDLSKNIIRTFSARESIKKIMQFGAQMHHRKLRERLSISFGAFNLLKKEKRFLILDIFKWLKKNKWIEKLRGQKGLVKDARIENLSKDLIKLSYSAFSKRTNKCEKYLVSFPRILILDKDFYYFLGLLYGDGLNGARVGLSNKDKNLIEWTANFLRKTFKDNKIKTQLFLYKSYLEQNILGLSDWLKLLSEETEVYKNIKARGNYVFTVFIMNNILKRILNSFFDNLESLFSQISFEQKGAFFAGFFDAEGNVNKLDKNLRFSQKIEIKFKTIQNLLNKEGYHTRYDGSNILIGYKKEYKGDLNLFEKQILPFIKHSTKTKEVGELLKGYFVKDSYKLFVKLISENSGITQKEIAEKVDRIKKHRELVALMNAGFIYRERRRIDESFKYYVTKKGIKWIGGN